MIMIKPNWDVFKAKFSDNPQRNFEWFCYLLFCKQFNKPYGIFRYKNQSAVENDPITIENEIIVWQAKFYDSSLSNHKDNLITTIEKARRDYPNITKLLIYTNQEWHQYKGQKPKGLVEIEQAAKKLSISLEWRTSSYFESEFVSTENEIFAKHFFTLEKGIFTQLEDLRNHADNILGQIQTNINFNGRNLEVDRDNKLTELRVASQQIVILSGIAGVGKTVLIKKFYNELEKKIPFYIFKATEFELNNIKELSKDFDICEFIKVHEAESKKIIVIDSSEKLLDIKNLDPFKEFLSALIRGGWKVVFTTRDNYVEDLNYQFIEIYNLIPLNINISKLELKESISISDEYSFSLPQDSKLLELIRIPFYLNEYLKFYTENEELDYRIFKEKLWNKNIIKSKPSREQCFINVAYERANNGQFFVQTGCETSALEELVKDGILGYETAGYFITHDIYEEWSLEKTIERGFINRNANEEFFTNIGQSLPIRRSYRKWLSEKLLLEDRDVISFIEETIENENIEQFWKDETLISVLLSNYSGGFFSLFEEKLLLNNNSLLKKISFLLRIACKEVDYELFKALGIKNSSAISAEEIFTKPKGQGWQEFIRFAFHNKESIGINGINYILPIISDWNNKIKKGDTTKLSSLIALYFYEMIIEQDIYYSQDNNMNRLLQTILNGSYEIMNELRQIIEQIIKQKWNNYRDPYYGLSNIILTELEGVIICNVLPESVLKLADLFWTDHEKDNQLFDCSPLELGHHFGLKSSNHDYYPASAYQTPVYWLLKSNPKITIDFILEITNRSIDRFVTTGIDQSIKTIEIQMNDGTTHKQHISNCLWNLYRGTGAPVAPNILQSIHMALEKYFLEMGASTESRVLEECLNYLLINTRSASITAVVASIVLAYPDKTFEIAQILFRTKEFIIHDTARLVFEQNALSLYSIGRNMGSNTSDIYDEERIKTCEDKHRQSSLEHLLLKYQLFRNNEITEKQVEKRQDCLWGILDNYYGGLPPEEEQTESDRTWRLFLARMDKRKMNIKTENTNEGIAIELNPEIDSNLREHSEKALENSNKAMKYIPLKLWAELKIKNDDKYKQYRQYEDNPLLALQEVKEIVTTIEAKKNGLQQQSEEAAYLLLNQFTPVYVCSALINNNIEELSLDDRCFCRDIILQVASSSLGLNYRYQISDGLQPAISTLPILLENFPEEKERIKTILLLNLFIDYKVGGFLSNESFSIFSVIAIQKLWSINFSDAQSLLFGYILLRPKYDELVVKIREENYKKNIYEPCYDRLWERFKEENENELQRVIDNELLLSDLQEIEEIDLTVLITAFRMIPQRGDNDDHKTIAKAVISAFCKKMASEDREERIDYHAKSEFLRTYAFFVLNLHNNEIEEYLKPFLDNFQPYEYIADLFEEFILAEDIMNTYDKFWLVWSTFEDKIINICKKDEMRRYVSKIVRSYLFATIPWSKSAKEWHSLRDENKKFFKKISSEMSNSPSCIYAIAKLLNNIGNCYIDDGVFWISSIIKNKQERYDGNIESATIYYLENLVRKYVYKNRERIKRSKAIKDNLLLILNYLITKGSVVGYMLRETVI